MRCSPGPMVSMLESMSQDMKNRLAEVGFKDFLGFNFGAIDERGLVYFLMDHVEMDPFRIEIDGRVLPLNREVAKFVLGIPTGPNALPVVSGLKKNNHKKEFRRLCDSKGLRDMYNKSKKMFPKRKDYSALNANEVHRWVVEEFATKGNGDDWSITCFCMALLDGILFPTTSVTLPGEIYRYCKVVGDVCQYDLCTAVIEDLKIKVGKWKKSSQKKTPSVQGCSILLLLYYLDNLQCPQHMLKDASALPCAAHLTATIADTIAKADRKILPDGSVTYGNLPFRSKAGTCYENVRADANANDCGYLIMLFMEHYDGEKRKLNIDINTLLGPQYRSQLLYYIMFHRRNGSRPLPPELEALAPQSC